VHAISYVLADSRGVNSAASAAECAGKMYLKSSASVWAGRRRAAGSTLQSAGRRARLWTGLHHSQRAHLSFQKSGGPSGTGH